MKKFGLSNNAFRRALVVALLCLILLSPGSFAATELNEIQVVKLLLVNNIDVRAARLDLTVASAQVLSAQGDFDPVIQVTPEWKQESKLSYSTTQDPFWSEETQSLSLGLKQKFVMGTELEATAQALGIRSTSTRSLFPKRTQTGVELTLTQPLFRGGGRAANLAEEHQTLAQEKKYRALLHDVVQKKIILTLSLYADLTADQSEVQAREEALALAEQSLKMSRIRLKTGAGSQLDLLKSEAAAELALARLVAAQVKLMDHQEQLLGEIVPIEEALPSDLPAFVAEGPQFGEREIESKAPHPELALLEAEREKAAIALRVAENDLLPQLDLEGKVSSAGLARSFRGATTNLTEFSAPSYSVTLNLSFPLFNGEAKGRLSMARATYDELDVSVRRKELALEREKRELELSGRNQGSRVELLEQRQEAENRRLAVSLDFFKHGRMGAQELSEAVDGSLDARVSVYREKAEMRKKALKDLALAGKMLKNIDDL